MEPLHTYPDVPHCGGYLQLLLSSPISPTTYVMSGLARVVDPYFGIPFLLRGPSFIEGCLLAPSMTPGLLPANPL